MQVDYDEVYREKDVNSVMKMLSDNPEITAVSFPYIQFWESFNYVQTGK